MARSTPAWLPTAWAIAALFGCGGSAPQPRSQPVDAPRIVSVSPALSRTLLDFGLQDHIVGRSGFCSSLDPAIPVVGDLHELDLERLIRLHPTHVLLQPPSAGDLDPQLLRLAERHGWALSRWTIDSIDDVEHVILGLPGALFTLESPQREEAARRAARLLVSIAEALKPPQGASWQGRTLLVCGIEPVLVAGRGTYLHDMLEALGAVNATAAEGWPELSLEDVLRLDPEAIVLVRDSGPPGIDPVEAAGALAFLNTTARRQGRIAVLFHPDALLPSSALIGVAAEMRNLLGRLAQEPE